MKLQETRAKEDIEIFNSFMYKQYAKMLLNDINSYKRGIDNNSGSEKNSGSGNSFSVFF
ncbi:MAG TPA: hypothetical protein VHZ50_01340 [Puia sp.]|nr:hypothetical protein [Puia sp.]